MIGQNDFFPLFYFPDKFFQRGYLVTDGVGFHGDGPDGLYFNIIGFEVPSHSIP